MKFSYAQKKVLPVGSKSSPLWIVGRCPTQQDYAAGVGYSKSTKMVLNEAFRLAGQEQAGLRAHKTFLIPHLPPLGKFESWLHSKKDLEASPYASEFSTYKEFLGPVGGKYLHPGVMPFVAELQAALQTARPNCILALGPEICFILTGEHRIGAARGALYDCRLAPGIKVIPTYNPSSIFANASFQPIFNADVAKAFRQSGFPERRIRSRRVHVAETIDDLQAYDDEFRSEAATVDIETIPNRKQITDIGIAYSDEDALVIPILDKSKPDYSYWSYEDEFRVWAFVRSILERPGTEIRGQGYTYDATWLYQLLLIKSVDYRGDPLCLHHALYPEMSKDLGFLGSLYCDEVAWKQLASFKAQKDK